MIKLKHLKKFFGNLKAIDDLSLDVPKGSICGIIGKSGAGKSTLIRCINLLERPDAGKIEVDGIDLTALNNNELRKHRREIGMIFQHFNLLTSKTVYENIALPLKLLGKDPEFIKAAVLPLLELIELEDKKNTYPSQLSGGQKQRVAIAGALVTQPKVLLCDEATSALDPKTTKSILNLLKNINENFGITILLITHEIEVIKEICDEVAVLDDGKLIEQSATLELFTNPKTQIAKDLIRDALKLELPEKISERLHIEETPDKIPILRIRFIGQTTTEPLLSSLVTRFGIHFNILQANIDIIQNQTIGIMVVEFCSGLDQMPEALNYLDKQGLHVEVIGYVANNN